MYDNLISKGIIKAEDQGEVSIARFEFYIDAFRELSTCRPSSQGLGPIPFTAIVEYARVFDVDDFEEFLYLVRLMDDVVLDNVNSKTNIEGNSNGTTTTDQKNHNPNRNKGRQRGSRSR